MSFSPTLNQSRRLPKRSTVGIDDNRTLGFYPAALAVELAAVAPHKNAGKRRDLYLDLKNGGRF
jgi:hypothetical protein